MSNLPICQPGLAETMIGALLESRCGQTVDVLKAVRSVREQSHYSPAR